MRLHDFLESENLNEKNGNSNSNTDSEIHELNGRLMNWPQLLQIGEGWTPVSQPATTNQSDHTYLSLISSSGGRQARLNMLCNGDHLHTAVLAEQWIVLKKIVNEKGCITIFAETHYCYHDKKEGETINEGDFIKSLPVNVWLNHLYVLWPLAGVLLLGFMILMHWTGFYAKNILGCVASIYIAIISVLYFTKIRDVKILALFEYPENVDVAYIKDKFPYQFAQKLMMRYLGFKFSVKNLDMINLKSQNEKTLKLLLEHAYYLAGARYNIILVCSSKDKGLEDNKALEEICCKLVNGESNNVIYVNDDNKYIYINAPSKTEMNYNEFIRQFE